VGQGGDGLADRIADAPAPFCGTCAKQWNAATLTVTPCRPSASATAPVPRLLSPVFRRNSRAYEHGPGLRSACLR
jgi:hypothetical protein